MKLYVKANNINHRGRTVNRGDIIEEEDRNHIGSLQSVGCVKYDPQIHGPEQKPEPVKAAEPEPQPETEPAPKPSKKKTAKKKAAKSFDA